MKRLNWELDLSLRSRSHNGLHKGWVSKFVEIGHGSTCPVSWRSVKKKKKNTGDEGQFHLYSKSEAIIEDYIKPHFSRPTTLTLLRDSTVWNTFYSRVCFPEPTWLFTTPCHSRFLIIRPLALFFLLSKSSFCFPCATHNLFSSHSWNVFLMSQSLPSAFI